MKITFNMIALILLTACDSEKIPDEEITLENCSGSATSDVPEIYSSLFKCVDLSIDGDDLVISSNGLAPHKSAYYVEEHPNYIAWDDTRGDDYFQNPGNIAEQDIFFAFPFRQRAAI